MSLPECNRQLFVTKLSNKYRDCTEIRSSPMPTPGDGEVLVKNKFLGVNASDIIFSSGGYSPDHKPPFVAGLESVGEIAAVGNGVQLKVGQSVVNTGFGSFGEFTCASAAKVVPVPSIDPAFMSIILSGMTASIALAEEGDLKAGKNVLVTAAAGGTGQFAVQLSKLAGCHVIGTCSSMEKADYLKSIGCDRVINYKEENVEEVLSKEYPKGIDVVYESIGKDMFDAALKNLAIKGRLIVIGQISTYERESLTDTAALCNKLPVGSNVLKKSASVRGFFLPHYTSEYSTHAKKLITLYMEGKLKVTVDNGEKVANGPFKTLEKCVDAVEYMYTRKNIGKIIVEI